MPSGIYLRAAEHSKRISQGVASYAQSNGVKIKEMTT